MVAAVAPPLWGVAREERPAAAAQQAGLVWKLTSVEAQELLPVLEEEKRRAQDLTILIWTSLGSAAAAAPAMGGDDQNGVGGQLMEPTEELLCLERRNRERRQLLTLTGSSRTSVEQGTGEGVDVNGSTVALLMDLMEEIPRRSPMGAEEIGAETIRVGIGSMATWQAATVLLRVPLVREKEVAGGRHRVELTRKRA